MSIQLNINDYLDLPCHVYLKNKDGHYLECNDNQAISAGYHQGKELIGARDNDLCWEKYASMYQENDKMIIANQSSQVYLEHIMYYGLSKNRITYYYI